MDKNRRRMVVDVPTCTVTWTRNGAAVKVQQQFKQLQDTSIKWVPWINLENKRSFSLLEETWAWDMMMCVIICFYWCRCLTICAQSTFTICYVIIIYIYYAMALVLYSQFGLIQNTNNNSNSNGNSNYNSINNSHIPINAISNIHINYDINSKWVVSS